MARRFDVCCTKFSASRNKRGVTTINTQNSTGRRIVYINKETSKHQNQISLDTPHYCGGWLQRFQVRVVDNLGEIIYTCTKKKLYVGHKSFETLIIKFQGLPTWHKVFDYLRMI